MIIHPSHRTHFSMDASSYDEVCDLCGATDGPIYRGRIDLPCPASDRQRADYDAKKNRPKPLQEKDL